MDSHIIQEVLEKIQKNSAWAEGKGLYAELLEGGKYYNSFENLKNSALSEARIYGRDYILSEALVSTENTLRLTHEADRIIYESQEIKDAISIGSFGAVNMALDHLKDKWYDRYVELQRTDEAKKRKVDLLATGTN